MTDNLYRIHTVNQIAELYPAFNRSSLRWLIFNAKQNGFHTCVKKIGRRVLIDAAEFEEWIKKQVVR